MHASSSLAFLPHRKTVSTSNKKPLSLKATRLNGNDNRRCCGLKEGKGIRVFQSKEIKKKMKEEQEKNTLQVSRVSRKKSTDFQFFLVNSNVISFKVFRQTPMCLP